MATRKPTSVRRTTPVETPAPAATRARRPGAVRRTTAAAPPALAAAPQIHEALSAPETAADEQIRVRAYYLHLERRGRPADPAADWLRAEQELAARRSAAPSPTA